MAPQHSAPSNNVVVNNSSSTSQQMSQFPPQPQPPSYTPYGFSQMPGGKVPYEKM